MATQVGSLIGVNLSGSDSTALFAGRTAVNGTGGSYFEYCEFTATQTTGAFVLITPDGTAMSVLTAKLAVGGAVGMDIGCVQNVVNQGEFGWVARKGANMYVKITNTMTLGTVQYGFSAAAGRIQNVETVAVGHTGQGVIIYATVSGGTQAVLATLLWPTSLTTFPI
jgi:hypothetical protein